jgi:serine/threonine-protein kinase
LKPENLFIVDGPEGPFVKILDFGISKFNTTSLSELRLTRQGASFGTPAYMAPEQLKNSQDVDARTDVFALGAVLFECLGGQAPYTVDAMLASGQGNEALQGTPLATLRAGLDPALLALVARALTVDRDQRLGSAHTLVEQLAPFRVGAANPWNRRRSASFDALAEPAASLPPVRRRPSRRGPVVALVLGVTLAGALAWWTHRHAAIQQAHAPSVMTPAPPVEMHLPAAANPAPSATNTPVAEPAPAPGVADIATKKPHKITPTKVPAPSPLPERAKSLGLAVENPFE